MIDILRRSNSSFSAAAIVGSLVGVAVISLYIGTGLLVAGWSLSAFLNQLSIETISYLLGMIALSIAFIGLPIATHLRFDLITPIAILVLIILGWLTLGAVQGLLSFQTIFGIALYAAYLSPGAIVLYAIFGGGEYLYRTKTSSR